MEQDTRRHEWNAAYDRGDNFLFYPNEEVIRFFARHVAKRTGLDTVQYMEGFGPASRILDFGCGLGRHVRLALDLELDGRGIDLSEKAITAGRSWLSAAGYGDAEERLVCGDGRRLPFEDGFFDAAVSHAVLDSMPFEHARAAMDQIARVLKPGALFYLDLISPEDSELQDQGFAGELTVSKDHEFGTVQSYFDPDKISRLLEGLFQLQELVLVRRSVLTGPAHASRYHVVAQRIIPRL